MLTVKPQLSVLLKESVGKLTCFQQIVETNIRKPACPEETGEVFILRINSLQTNFREANSYLY
jgi:hypothetical protein